MLPRPEEDWGMDIEPETFGEGYFICVGELNPYISWPTCLVPEMYNKIA